VNLAKLIILNSLFITSTFAGATIDEEVYITNPTKELVKLIQQNPSLNMDHMDKNGFELYGPKGTKQWLSDIGVSYREESHNHKNFDKDVLKYPSFEQVERNLKSYVALNPHIAKLISIGKSVEGRDLWVVKISDNVNVDEVEPEFKYISSMHGNEITGRELTQSLIKDIITAYGTDKRITDLVNNTEIYIMPSMNPDGSKRQQRANAKRKDLNRDFPDWVSGDINSAKQRQVETKAIMKFQAERQFSLSANFHGGAVVVNYPWDSTSTRHPFDKLVKELSIKYADENPEMRNSRRFNQGVTNGADWYVLNGGMQDWSYHWHNDLQVTVELSSDKWPRYSQIPKFYKNNKESLLVYINEIHQGGGFKLMNSKKGGKVKIKKVLTNGQTEDKGTYGFSKGEFYKYLSTGEYEFYVTTEGSSVTKKVSVFVDGSIKPNGNYVKVN